MSKLKIQNFLLLIIAGLINAFGVTVFLYPVKNIMKTGNIEGKLSLT